MPSLLVHTFVCVCVLTVPAHVSTHTTETVVGVAGRKVMLPCRAEAEKQRDVEVCWGRGEPSVFTCHNTVIYATGDKISYRRSYRLWLLSLQSSTARPFQRPDDQRSPHHHQLYVHTFTSSSPAVPGTVSQCRPMCPLTPQRRWWAWPGGKSCCRVGQRRRSRGTWRYSLSSSSSLSIALTRPSDSGFYHCRVQLPGLFNDQTTSVHLIITSYLSVLPDSEDRTFTDVRAATGVQRGQTGDTTGDVTAADTGSDVTATTQPMTALVQSVQQKQQVNGPQMFIGNTLRLSFIIFIPVLLLTAAYRVWGCGQRAKTDRRLNQSEDGDIHTCV
uniref:hepatitis A virus cellular receptor 1 homolog isoform X1 n=1 Tax=Solea senegalensis TaxID=28829 RepID=UPI001CD8779D|nr:hepatitis A virus cellular receptor 1 homolog isoform X1 [Solea senegalensis]XP_043897418.1 hepatitis A virus cellular receptor 1 homolog isoform X1 [Solea senegalensis]